MMLGARVDLRPAHRARGTRARRQPVPRPRRRADQRARAPDRRRGSRWKPMSRPTEEGARRVVEMLRQRFNHVVIDLPMPPGPVERMVLQRARHVVLVLAPDVAEHPRHGVGEEAGARWPARRGRVITVLNGAGRRGYLPIKLIAEGIGAMPEVVIPDLPRQLPRAANLGRPALRDSPALRRALGILSQEIAAVRVGRPRDVRCWHACSGAEADHAGFRPPQRRRQPPRRCRSATDTEARSVNISAADIALSDSAELRPPAHPGDGAHRPGRRRRTAARRAAPAARRAGPRTRQPRAHGDLGARPVAHRRGDRADDMLGYGPLEPLLEDDSITDIMVNGPEQRLRRAARQADAHQRAVPRCHAHVAAIAQRIAARVGRRIDESSPMVRRAPARRLPRQHRVPAAGARRPLHLDPQIRQAAASTSAR